MMNIESNIQQLVGVAFNQVLEKRNRSNSISGVSTGIKDIDSCIDGLQEGQLIILAARPSMGKTGFALTLAGNIAVDAGIPVAYFSLCTSASQMTQRLLLMQADIDTWLWRSECADSAQIEQLEEAAEKLKTAPLSVWDGMQCFNTVAKTCRKLKASKQGLRVVIIDDVNTLYGNEQQITGECETLSLDARLKELAQELRVTILLLSQLHRQIEKRHDKRPRLADLFKGHGTGAAADIIAFLYRIDYYMPEVRFKDYAEFIIAYQRDGVVGTVPLNYRRETYKFFDQPYEPYHPPVPPYNIDAESPDNPLSTRTPITVQNVWIALNFYRYIVLERALVELLHQMGYGGSRKEIAESLDSSVENQITGVIKKDPFGMERILIIAVKNDKPLKRTEAQKLISSTRKRVEEDGILFATRTVSDEARLYLKRIRPGLAIVEGKELAELLVRYDVKAVADVITRQV